MGSTIFDSIISFSALRKFRLTPLRSSVTTGCFADWITSNAKTADRRGGIDVYGMPIELQEFLEGYIPEYIPQGRVVNVWFDVYDIEEGRI